MYSNVLVSGKPRTLIPGECGALAGHLSGFRPPLLPRYAGLSTTFIDAIISDRGPLARLRRGFDFDAILDYARRERWENVRTQNGDGGEKGMYEFKIHLFHACIGPSTEFCIQFINSIMCCLGIRKKMYCLFY